MNKFKGIIPAFYACYNDDGSVSKERTKSLVKWLSAKGVKGLYLCGSSGECIYQTVDERKQILEWVMEEPAAKELTIIAHVAANSIGDSQELARHAEEMKVDAIAAIPPIYFKLPEYSIAEYWNAISEAAPNTDFFIYNIPQLAGVGLTTNLLREMLKNPRIIGVKNSSMPVQDIQMFCSEGGEDFVVLNGPDEQYLGGRIMGAVGGIGGTYGVMPELFIKIDSLIESGDLETARKLQYDINAVIYKAVDCHGNLYSAMKEILRKQGVDIGVARPPLAPLSKEDYILVDKAYEMIEQAKAKYL